jgi:hypothetical protein
MQHEKNIAKGKPQKKNMKKQCDKKHKRKTQWSNLKKQCKKAI